MISRFFINFFCGLMIVVPCVMNASGFTTPDKFTTSASRMIYGTPNILFSTPNTAMQGMQIGSPFAVPASPIAQKLTTGVRSGNFAVSPIGSSGLFSPSSINSAGAGSLSTSLDSSGATSGSLSSISVNKSLVDSVKARTGRKKITSEDVGVIKQAFQDMQNTPGGSKKGCAQAVYADVSLSLFESPTVDTRKRKKRPLLVGEGYTQDVVENDQALWTLRAVLGNKSKERRLQVLAAAVAAGGTPARSSATVVDTHHCMVPELKINKKTGEIIQVSGGHDEHSYDSAVLDPVYFENNGRKGLSIGGVEVKTVEPGFNHVKILDVVKQSTVVATNDSGSFKVVQAPDGRYYGCHPDLSNPLIINSIFPLITITYNSVDSPSKPVQFGSITQVSPGRSTVHTRQNLVATQAEFAGLIGAGDRLRPDPKATVHVIDVTAPVAARYGAELQATGLIKYPPVFAIVPKS